MEYSYRLRCGKYGYNWFNLGSNSCNKCPSISCASFTNREDPEIKISPIVVPYRSTLPPFLLMVIVLMVIDYPLWLYHVHFTVIHTNSRHKYIYIYIHAYTFFAIKSDVNFYVQISFFINSFPIGQNGCKFADNKFKWNFVNAKLAHFDICYWCLFLGMRLLWNHHWFR